MRKLLLTLLVATGCALTPYSQQSVNIAGSLRDQSTALIAKAIEPFENHRDSVMALRTRLLNQLSAERNRKDNSESVAQWGLLADAQGSLLGGFLTRWEQQGTLGQLFINAKRTQVVTAFRIIIETEEAKR